jgi:Zn-dependent metalloprotease
LADELEAFDNRLNALSANDIDSYTENVTSIIISSASRSKKITQRRSPRSMAPWWTEELEILRKSTRKAYKKWSRSRWTDDRLSFNSAKGVFQHRIRKAKNDSIKKFIEEMNGNSNSTFKELKKKVNPSQPEQFQMEINVNGIPTTDSALILTRFVEHFFPIEGVSDESHRQTEQSVKSALQEAKAESTLAPTITQGEVLIAAKSLKKKSAPGWDELSTLYFF